MHVEAAARRLKYAAPPGSPVLYTKREELASFPHVLKKANSPRAEEEPFPKKKANKLGRCPRVFTLVDDRGGERHLWASIYLRRSPLDVCSTWGDHGDV
jgi:hypothetical protein